MRRRAAIPQRRRIFLGCEGESERGYAAFLNQVLRERFGLHIAITPEVLRPGGGDPLALIELAVQRIARNERNHGPYHLRAVLLDSDKLGADIERDQSMLRVAQEMEIRLIFQEPAHEAFLLRHLNGCQQHRPPTTPLALTALRREWPIYRKAMSAREIADRIDDAGIRQACEVEPSLRAFLIELGFQFR